MTFFRSGSGKKDQRGFTIVELLVYLAIFSLLSGVVTFAVIQMLKVNASSNNRITAIRQVQNAGYWVSKDAQQAQVVLYDDPNTEDIDELLVLSWAEWENATKNVVVYNLADGELVRSHYQGGEYYQDGTLVDETIVARLISSAGFEEDAGSEMVNMIVTATVGGFQQVSETRVYEIIPRAGL